MGEHCRSRTSLLRGGGVPRELFARELERRLDGRITPERAAVVRRVARMSSSPASLAWLLVRSGRDVRGESEMLGIENQLIKGIFWNYAQRAKAVLRRYTKRSTTKPVS
jgi:hypothetical protein